MKKLSFLLLILLVPVNGLFSQKVVINSDYFSRDKNLIRLIRNNLRKGEQLKGMIDTYLVRKGYVFSRVLSVKQRGNSVFVGIEEGRVNRIIIYGDAGVSRGVLDSYLSLRSGDIFNRNKFRLQIKKLQGLKLFENIYYKIIIPRKTIWIKVMIRKKRYFQVDGNYTTSYGLMPYLGFIDRGLFGSRIYMDLNAETGFWDELKYVKFNPCFNAGNLYLEFYFRKGKTYIKNNDYASEEERFSIGKNFPLSKNSDLIFSVPLEHYFFYRTAKFRDQIFIDGLRFGLTVQFTFNNRRDVIEKREETDLRLKAALLYFNKKKDHYIRLTGDFKTYFRLLEDMGLVFRNSSGTIGNYRPLDTMLLIGGENQRGYVEGTAIADLKFENTVELEYELFFNLIKSFLFLDTSYYREKEGTRFLMSYGPGLLFNLMNFNVQVCYGAPFKAGFFTGNIYLSISKMIY
ncbi:MAG: hypothetical protein PHF84_06645 [bacterium]|nr:hypothetical protein [bacterium]